jgi:hypothetical protein
MMARISPGSMHERQVVERLEAVERHRDAVEIEHGAGLVMSFRRLRLRGPRLRFGDAGVGLAAAAPPLLPACH